MKNTILARRYAKALFAVGKEENAFEEYSKALGEMAELFESVPEVGDALTNPLYSVETKTKVMESLVEKMGHSAVMANFFRLLVQKKRAGALPEIAEEFQVLVDEEQNICKGTVISATELGSTLKTKVKETLEKITGKNVVLSTQVDPSIIGGLIAKVGDLVMDGSIKTQLTGLKEAIKGSE